MREIFKSPNGSPRQPRATDMDQELSNKIAEFVADRSAKERVEKAWHEHGEFLRLYPFREHPEQIDALTPDKIYNPNQGGRTYFFYWIEHGLKEFAHLGIGSAIVWKNARNDLPKLKELLRAYP